MLKVALTIVLVALGLHDAAARATAASGDKYQAWGNEAVRALAARSDANSLATAAALRFANLGTAPGIPTALELIVRASDLAPENAGIGWLHLQICAATANCDARDAATVLRWVDPDNSAAWINQLSVAHKDKDTMEIERLLADMAHGTRFDLYYNQIVILMFDALSAVRRELPARIASSDLTRLNAVSGVAGAEIAPPFSGLLDSCRDSLPGSERHYYCLKVAKIMQRSDTVTAQMAGFGLEKRLVTPDGKDAKSVAERYRSLEWRVTAAAKLDESILPWTQNARARTRLAEMRLRPREEDVYVALLREYKIALEPLETQK